MNYEIDKIYDDADEYFAHQGVSSMRLTRGAAQHVCERALAYGLLIVRIEGGIWRNPDFEARLDCIWDGLDPPVSVELANENNGRAFAFIVSCATIHDVFVITTAPLTGWWHHGHRPTPV